MRQIEHIVCLLVALYISADFYVFGENLKEERDLLSGRILRAGAGNVRITNIIKFKMYRISKISTVKYKILLGKYVQYIYKYSM